MADVQVQVGPSDLKVLINGIPYILLRRADLSAIQAWIRRIGAVEPFYEIEFTTKNGSIKCDYSDRELWEKILRALGHAHIFEVMEGQPDVSA
jgi:hypothetical protein